MKNKILIIMLVVFTIGLVGCSNTSKDKINEYKENTNIVGLYRNIGGEGDMYDFLPYKIIITSNKEVEVYVPDLDRDDNIGRFRAYEDDYRLEESIPLTDEQYKNICKIDIKKLSKQKPKEDRGVLDGWNTYILVYDKDNNEKEVGGYMTRNEFITDTYDYILDNIPKEEIIEIHDKYIENLKQEVENYNQLYEDDYNKETEFLNTDNNFMESPGFN